MADQASSIFGSDKGQPPAVKPNEGQPPTGDNPLATLVGEGRKYKSIDDLAKAYLQADGFIEQLKGENAQLREKAATAKTVDDVLQAMRKQPEASTTDKGEDKGSQGLSADAVAKIVRDTVTGLETQKSREANLLKADAEMKKLFGDKAQEVFAAQAATPEAKQALMQLASVAPDKFVKLFSPGEPAKGSQTDSGSTVNSAALADTNQSARAMDPGCKEYFEAMRKDPKRRHEYYGAANQLAMHKAAQANPEKFFGRKLGS